MADRRRADDTPLAPRRPLSGPVEGSTDGGAAKRPLSERVSAAVSAAGSRVQSATSSGSSSPQSSGSQSSGSQSSGSQSSSSVSRSGAASASGATTPATPTTGSGTATSSTRSGGTSSRPRGTRRARLRLVHLDPWSVMKTAFLLSIALGIVVVVSVFVVWSVLNAAGVFDSVNKTVADLVGGTSAQSFDVQNYVGLQRVLGFAMVIAVVDVVLVTAIATLSAFLYNLSAALLGGVEVTLAEDER
jgi:hypothetical protein